MSHLNTAFDRYAGVSFCCKVNLEFSYSSPLSEVSELKTLYTV